VPRLHWTSTDASRNYCWQIGSLHLGTGSLSSCTFTGSRYYFLASEPKEIICDDPEGRGAQHSITHTRRTAEWLYPVPHLESKTAYESLVVRSATTLRERMEPGPICRQWIGPDLTRLVNRKPCRWIKLRGAIAHTPGNCPLLDLSRARKAYLDCA